MSQIAAGTTLGRLRDGAQRGLETTANFLRARLEAKDEDRLWACLSLVFGMLPAWAFATVAFRRSDSLHDDARQFLAWMSRWDDPELLRGDLITDYFASVTPWAYDVLFHAAWWAGIEPVLLSRLLPLVLLPLTALCAFRFLRAMHADPLAAFVGVAFTITFLAGNNSGTPRGFWPLLLFIVMEGLARSRVIQTALAQLLLAGMYPQMSLVTAAVIGMTFFKPSERLYIDLGRARITLVLASAVATLAGLLPFFLSTSTFGPAFSLEEARSIATFQAQGRTPIFQHDGSLALLCNQRTGLLGQTCGGRWYRRAILVGMVAGPAILLWRSLFKASRQHFSSPLPFYLLIASLGWFAVATALLFRLHLPPRYSYAVKILPMLTAIPILVTWGRDRLPLDTITRSTVGRLALVACVLAALLWGALGASVFRGLRGGVAPRSPALIEAIAALPKDEVVAGFVSDLDFVPVQARRSVLFTYEHAIPYQKGYFLQMMARVNVMRDIFLTRDPAVFARQLSVFRIDWFFVGKKNMAEARILPRFRGFFGPELATEEEAGLKLGPTVLAQRATACTAGEIDGILMLDAACLRR